MHIRFYWGGGAMETGTRDERKENEKDLMEKRGDVGSIQCDKGTSI